MYVLLCSSSVRLSSTFRSVSFEVALSVKLEYSLLLRLVMPGSYDYGLPASHRACSMQPGGKRLRHASLFSHKHWEWLNWKITIQSVINPSECTYHFLFSNLSEPFQLTIWVNDTFACTCFPKILDNYLFVGLLVFIRFYFQLGWR